MGGWGYGIRTCHEKGMFLRLSNARTMARDFQEKSVGRMTSRRVERSAMVMFIIIMYYVIM